MPKKGQSMRNALYFGNNWTGLPGIVWIIGVPLVIWWFMRDNKSQHDLSN